MKLNTDDFETGPMGLARGNDCDHAQEGHDVQATLYRALVERLRLRSGGSRVPVEADVESEEAPEQVPMSGSFPPHVDCELWGDLVDGAGRFKSGPAFLEVQEPWEEPVEGRGLFTEVQALFHAHLDLRPFQSLAMSLFAPHTYCFEAFAHTPYLAFTSPVRGCGKTESGLLTMALCNRGVAASNYTAPVLFRISHDLYPVTMFLDELDSVSTDRRALTNILNAGHTKKSAWVYRCGKEGSYACYYCYGPRILASIGAPPKTVADRCITIKLQKALPGAGLRELDESAYDSVAVLSRKIQRWALDNKEAVAEAHPKRPLGLPAGRPWDKWKPILSVADVVGGEWPKWARQAALKLDGQGTSDPDNGIILLQSLRRAFEELKCAQAGSVELVSWLLAQIEEPWSEFGSGRGMTPFTLADMLRAFEIRSKNIRTREGVVKGYSRADFEDAWARYCPRQAGAVLSFAGTSGPVKSPSHPQGLIGIPGV